jgi:hypothetical protein
MSWVLGRLPVVILATVRVEAERRAVAVSEGVDVRVVVDVDVELPVAEGSADVGSTELSSLELGVALLGWAVTTGTAVRCVPPVARM